jgi:hypothetical protein
MAVDRASTRGVLADSQEANFIEREGWRVLPEGPG